MHIIATDDREDLNVICAYAFKRQIETLITVYVRKIDVMDDICRSSN